MSHRTGQLALVWGLVLASVLAGAEETAEVPALAAACTTCHGSGGGASIPGWPALTSMSETELASKLQGYREQRNPDSRMSDVSHSLTDEDIRSLAEYFSRQ